MARPGIVDIDGEGVSDPEVVRNGICILSAHEIVGCDGVSGIKENRIDRDEADHTIPYHTIEVK